MSCEDRERFKNWFRRSTLLWNRFFSSNTFSHDAYGWSSYFLSKCLSCTFWAISFRCGCDKIQWNHFYAVIKFDEILRGDEWGKGIKRSKTPLNNINFNIIWTYHYINCVEYYARHSHTNKMDNLSTWDGLIGFCI